MDERITALSVFLNSYVPNTCFIFHGKHHLQQCFGFYSRKYQSIFPYCNTPSEDYMQVDCDLKSKCKNRQREKLKGDSVKIASVVCKNKLKTAVLLYYGRRWSRDRTATLRQHDNISWQSIPVTDRQGEKYHQAFRFMLMTHSVSCRNIYSKSFIPQNQNQNCLLGIRPRTIIHQTSQFLQIYCIIVSLLTQEEPPHPSKGKKREGKP